MPTTTLITNSGVAYVGASTYTPSEAPGIGDNGGPLYMAVYGFAAAGLPAGAIINGIRLGFTTALSTSSKPWKVSASTSSAHGAARSQVYAATVTQVRNQYHEVALSTGVIDFSQPFFLFFEENGSGNTYGEVYKWNHATYKVTVYIDWEHGISVPTVNPTSQALGNAVTINTNRSSASLTHTLKYTFGNQSGTVASGVGESFVWTLPVELASVIPNAASGTLTITCETYLGGVLTGTSTVNLTVTVPNNATFAPSASLETTGNALLDGEYVQGISTVSGEVATSGKYGAGIASIRTVISNLTYNGASFTSSPFSATGSVTATTTVTDSRGFTATAAQSITVRAYSPPQITTLSAYRCDASGNALSSGTYIRMNYALSLSSVNGKNNWITRSLSWSGGTQAITDTSGYVVLPGADANTAYTITITVQDLISGAVTSQTSVVRVQPVFDVYPNGLGVGLGTEAVEGAVTSAWPWFGPLHPPVDNIFTTGMLRGGWRENGTNLIFKVAENVVYMHLALRDGTTTDGTLVLSGLPPPMYSHAFICFAYGSGASGGVFISNVSGVGQLTCNGPLSRADIVMDAMYISV